ncbi:MAG TPA: Gmad2 immunoglobulin-like domain-containing protein [Salinimicrobium sp.]|nr:Gmad2 immunoglobulin-like domain-containing protein [Salinimicrobium sp.]
MKINKYLCLIVLSLFLISCKKEKEKNISIQTEVTKDSVSTKNNNENHELIHVDQPEVGTSISSPIEISGKARGYWFFEASAPIDLINDEGEVIAQGYIEATEPWMTEEFVPFKGEISFETEKEFKGFLLFHKANPSGLKEHADSYKIPVIFKQD